MFKVGDKVMVRGESFSFLAEINSAPMHHHEDSFYYVKVLDKSYSYLDGIILPDFMMKLSENQIYC